MQVATIVLNKTECLEELLKRFGEARLTGATILDSRGMAMELADHDELRFIGSLRMLMEPKHKENKTILMVVADDQVALVSRILNEVTGGLDKPDTGILYTTPVTYMEGLVHEV